MSRQKEIGGYFELEELVHHEYYPTLIALNTARNAFAYLCAARSVRKVYLPFFLCASVSNVCRREGIEYEFYRIRKDFSPIFYKKLERDERLYIVNYYGQLTFEQIVEYQVKHKNIIIDNVQAFFAEPLDGVDTIYSCRKFFGVPDGAYLSAEGISAPVQEDNSAERMRHIIGRYEGFSALEFYSDFKENDHSFETTAVRGMSRLTHNLLGAIDYPKVMMQREKNWEYLHSVLSERNSLPLRRPVGPYMYPYYCRNGMQVKNQLAKRGIYVPTLWPNVLELTGCELERDYAKNILPLPIDQRYGKTEMERVVEEVLACEY